MGRSAPSPMASGRGERVWCPAALVSVKTTCRGATHCTGRGATVCTGRVVHRPTSMCRESLQERDDVDGGLISGLIWRPIRSRPPWSVEVRALA